MKKAYFAGGCFWGVEHLFSLKDGVIDVVSGYAQSDIPNPTYLDLTKKRCSAVEAVEIKYDESMISYLELLELFSKAVDLTTLNKQGVDIGIQYRSGIYFTDETEKVIAEKFFASLQKTMEKKIVVELEELKNFTKAEEYHQDYIKKNPAAPCHIDFSILEE